MFRGWERTVLGRIDPIHYSQELTDIIPGFVDTPLIQGKPEHFWIAPVEKTARQIYAAIRQRRRQAYVTRRWRLIAWFLRLVPPFWHERL